MSVPVVRAETATAQAYTNTPNVTLPSTVAAGDLLIVSMSAYGLGSESYGTPSGFTKRSTANGGAYQQLINYLKVATGSEASQNVSLSIPQGNRRWVMTAWIIETGTHDVTNVSTDVKATKDDVGVDCTISGLTSGDGGLFAMGYASSVQNGGTSGYSMFPMNSSNPATGDVYSTKVVDRTNTSLNRSRQAWWYRTDPSHGTSERAAWNSSGTYEGYATGTYDRGIALYIPAGAPPAEPANNPPAFTFGKLRTSDRVPSYHPRPPRSWT